MSASGGGGGETEPKWPTTVTFQEPKSGYAQISVSVEGLEVKKATLGLFGKAIPTNAEVLKQDFKAEMVWFKIKVTKLGEEEKVIEYKKKLPEVIIPENCKYEVKKGWLVLHLCKEKDQSWATYHKDLGKRDE